MKKLSCAVQNYDWGKPASESVVAKLIKAEEKGEKSTKPYAELWMGTHPNGPSTIHGENLTLADYLTANPTLVGRNERSGLRYLFKVLSVGKALSIQTHPTKAQAEMLHAKDPKNYPDDNHKPEIAIALSRFEVLCGFRPHHELISNFKAYHELLDLINGQDLDKLAVELSEEQNRTALKALFSAVWKSPLEKIAKVVADIVGRISKTADRPDVEELMLRLNAQYPGGDVGVLAPLFLNHFTLEPGESTFLGPNEPHAYLSGDCVECMACSDNTIRAGLTPKYKDVETLCENLTYKMSPPPRFESQSQDVGVTQYSPPVEEFAVQRIESSARNVPVITASSIIIVVGGGATLRVKAVNCLETSTTVETGDVWFLPVSASLDVDNAADDFLAFRAFTSPNDA